jgi:hypothetical protein
LLGVVVELVETVNSILPQRIARALGFPVPSQGQVIYELWEPVLGRLNIPVSMISGGFPTLFEPVPKEGLMEYIDEDIINQTETHRLDLWID